MKFYNKLIFALILYISMSACFFNSVSEYRLANNLEENIIVPLMEIKDETYFV